MRKARILTAIIVLFIGYNLCFSYTIISLLLKGNLVGKVYCNRGKYDFPVCIINPITIKKIDELIVEHASGSDSDETHLLINNGKPRFKIVSMNKEEKRLCFLLQDIERNNDICIVFTDKKAKTILDIRH